MPSQADPPPSPASTATPAPTSPAPTAPDREKIAAAFTALEEALNAFVEPQPLGEQTLEGVCLEDDPASRSASAAPAAKFEGADEALGLAVEALRESLGEL